MSMSPETQNMKLKRNMVYFTQEEMYVNPLGIRRLALTPALFNFKILLGKKRPFKELIVSKRYEETISKITVKGDGTKQNSILKR